jgi:hypothetical protein
MATVLIDRYEAHCSTCGWGDVFMVGGNAGEWDAQRRARALHAQAVDARCSPEITLVKLTKDTP